VLLASFCNLVFAERSRRTEKVSVFIGLQYSTVRQFGQMGDRTGLVKVKFTSRILEGKRWLFGSVERRTFKSAHFRSSCLRRCNTTPVHKAARFSFGLKRNRN